MNLIMLASLSCLINIGILISIPFRTKKLLSDAGTCVMLLKKRSSIRWIFIAILSFCLIAVILFRNLGTFMNIIVCLCAIIAMHIGCKEGVSFKHDGIYENMIISGTFVIPYDEIMSLPTLSYEDNPDTTEVDKTTLQVVRKTGVQTLLIFSDETERSEAVKKIIEAEPRLKP